MEYLEVNGQKYEVTGYADDGLPILKAEITTSEDGEDAEGNPIRNVQIKVPSVTIGMTPGEVK